MSTTVTWWWSLLDTVSRRAKNKGQKMTSTKTYNSDIVKKYPSLYWNHYWWSQHAISGAQGSFLKIFFLIAYNHFPLISSEECYWQNEGKKMEHNSDKISCSLLFQKISLPKTETNTIINFHFLPHICFSSFSYLQQNHYLTNFP